MDGIIDIINKNTLWNLKDIDRTTYDLVKYIKKLEKRISKLEETVDMLYSEYENEHDPYRNG